MTALLSFLAWWLLGFLVIRMFAIKDQDKFPRDFVDFVLGALVAPVWPLYAFIRILRMNIEK